MAQEPCQECQACAYPHMCRECCGKTQSHEREWVIEQYLQRVDKKWILKNRDHSKYESCETARTRTIAVRYQEQGNHASQCDAAPLWHMIEPYLMKDDRKREHECHVYQHVRGEMCVFQLYPCEYSNQHCEQGEYDGWVIHEHVCTGNDRGTHTTEKSSQAIPER